MNVKLKIGLDIHGVISRKPEVFALLSRTLVDAGHEVHVITGSATEYAKKELAEYGITYTHLFSITDHHIKMGTEKTHFEEGRPCFSPRIWDKTKAEYCREQSIHLHLDDSLEYAKYFREPTLFSHFPSLGK
jgi:phosphoserine phosphatase